MCNAGWFTPVRQKNGHMRFTFIVLQSFCLFAFLISCKKDNKEGGCFDDLPTVREISHKKATVKMTATMSEPVYLVEDGTIDTRLIPCEIPLEFQQEGLRV